MALAVAVASSGLGFLSSGHHRYTLVPMKAGQDPSSPNENLHLQACQQHSETHPKLHTDPFIGCQNPRFGPSRINLYGSLHAG